MKIEFRLSAHRFTNEPMVEVWGDGLFIASIYGQEHGLKIITKFDIELVTLMPRLGALVPVPATVELNIDTKKRKEST